MSSALARLTRYRIDVVGMRLFGPYRVGKFDARARRRNGREELSDLRAYHVVFDRLERPGPSPARDLVERITELLWDALDLQFEEALLAGADPPFTVLDAEHERALKFRGVAVRRVRHGRRPARVLAGHARRHRRARRRRAARRAAR